MAEIVHQDPVNELLICPNNPDKICPQLIELDLISCGKVLGDPEYVNDGRHHAEQYFAHIRTHTPGQCDETPKDQCTLWLLGLVWVREFC